MIALVSHAIRHRIPHRVTPDPAAVPPGWVPMGSVEWVEAVLGRVVRPDYCPAFLRPWLRRRTWSCAAGPRPLPAFIKPADRHKRFPGTLLRDGDPCPPGPLWCSEPAEFAGEWRLYVASGRVVASGWYRTPPGAREGHEGPVPAVPGLPWPTGWCGAADFGLLADGSISLVESHPPYACGWYGEEAADYARFLAAGWEWLRGLPAA